MTAIDPPGQIVHLLGRNMHIYRTGQGSPTVVLEAGGGGWSLDWYLVQEKLAAITQVCSYDRAGFGWSDLGPEPRHAQALASELHTLLSATHPRGPYILVGASFGGHIVRLLAADHPAVVAGLVLLDARHEDIDSEMPPSWAKLQRSAAAAQRVMLVLARSGLLRLAGKLGGDRSLPPAARFLPPGILEAYLQVGFQPKYFQTNLAELKAISLSDAQVRAATLPANKPGAIIRHGVPDLFASLSPADASAAEGVWQKLQEDLVVRFPHTRLIVAETSGHAIQYQQPELVVDVVRELVLQHRKAG